MRYYIPLAALMVLHVIFLLLDVYAILHVDSAMHLAGGVALAVCIFGLLTAAVGRRLCPDPGSVVTFLLVVSLVTSGAVCWEFYEWLSDQLFNTQLQNSLTDTMKDLFLGMLGGALYTGYRLMAGDGEVGAGRRGAVRTDG